MGAPQATLGRNLSHALDFSIGCVPLRVSFEDEKLQRAAARRYEAFRSAREASPPIRIFDSFTGEPRAGDFSFEWEGARLTCGGAEAVFSGVKNEYALDSLLRVLLSWILLPRSGFLLHAATILLHGRACIFTGRSGAGKSTMASLAPAGSVLTDEISLLCSTEAGWHAHGTPFWGEFRAGDSQAAAPVAGVFQIVQAPRNRAHRLRPTEAIRMLLPNVLFFSADPAANRLLLDILVRVATDIPCYRLEFHRDPSVWEALPI